MSEQSVDPDQQNPNVDLYADKSYPDPTIELRKLFDGFGKSEEGRQSKQILQDMGEEIVHALATSLDGDALAGLAINAHDVAQKLPEGPQKDLLLTFTRLFSLATAEKTGEPVIVNKQEI